MISASKESDWSGLFIRLKKVIGPVFKALRSGFNVSFLLFSKKSGISETELNLIENGTEDPTSEQFQNMCGALGVEPKGFLCDLESEQKRHEKA
jgi:transcriptional regulator with XRE-family HTH domain